MPLPGVGSLLSRLRGKKIREDIPTTSSLVLCTDDDRLRSDVEVACPAGVALRATRDARQAWDVLRSETPAALVVDLQTGSAGGFALARDMSQVPRLARVPMAILLERAQDEWLAREAGATVVAVKPFDVDAVLNRVLSVDRGEDAP